jgi:hypothetical protein
MKMSDFINFNECLGRSTLLYGETDTEKTYITANFVKFLVESKKFNPKEISILDFAPKLTYFKNIKIGGKIEDYYPKSLSCYSIKLDKEIIPPRLKAKNKKELYKNICHNYKITSKILKKFNENQTPILIINDISIYLHLGSRNYLIETIRKAKTFFGNTYYGTTIKSKFNKLFNLKEKFDVDFLIKNVDKSYLTK